MPRITDKQVTHTDILWWLDEESKYLTKSSDNAVLRYLALHAYRWSDEEVIKGQVYEAHSYIGVIAEHTGLHQNTVRRSLQNLQQTGYIYRRDREGNPKGASHEIFIFWVSDTDRVDIRRGRIPDNALLWSSIPTTTTYHHGRSRGTTMVGRQASDLSYIEDSYRSGAEQL